MSSPQQDKILRQKLKQKDYNFQQQLKDEMQKEQENLKGYFKEFKKPVDQDPKKIKRSQSAAADRTMIFKQALKPFTLFSTFYQFWNMQCATPQEHHTLQICKKNYVKNTVKGIGISLIITSIVSFRFRSIFTPAVHLLGVTTALMSGFVFGAINSTKFTLSQFEKLGQGFELGRIANFQIEKYRMDQSIKKLQQVSK